MNGKSKGNSFERAASKKLSLWASNGKKTDLFFRTHSSGGRYTQNLKRTNTEIYNQAGDIVSTHPSTVSFSNKFVVEVKFYKEFDFFTILKTNAKGNLVLKWWDKLSAECAHLNKHPMMILKFNNKPPMAVFDDVVYTSIISHFTFDVMFYFKNKNRKMGFIPVDELCSTDYNKFMEHVVELKNNTGEN